MNLPEKIQAMYDKFYNDEELWGREKIDFYKVFLKELERSAQEGDPNSQFVMGQHYEDENHLGLNFYYDDKRCFFWYERAADNDQPDACNSLAVMYEGGIGTEVNLELAHFYYMKGSELGNDLARENLKVFEKEHQMG